MNVSTIVNNGEVMTEDIKQEIIKLTDLATPIFAKKLNISSDAGLYILRLLDHLPEIELYHKSLRKLTK